MGACSDVRHVGAIAGNDGMRVLNQMGVIFVEVGFFPAMSFDVTIGEGENARPFSMKCAWSSEEGSIVGSRDLERCIADCSGICINQNEDAVRD